MMRKAVAFTVAASLLMADLPASAEEPTSTPVESGTASRARTTQKVFIYSGYGLSAIGFGLSFVFLAQADSAYTSRQELARQNGSATSGVWQCSGPTECGRMRELRDDQTRAMTLWAAMTGVGVAGAVAGTAFLIAHLLDSPTSSKRSARILPAVSHQHAGFQLQGSF
ncbi:MAG TPA: hypothetical protein VM580_29895 [Labilithrix sp.]|jgi:hypothetical protein|nr:hypothetical protein [Labilithrix sp.]